MILDTQMLFYCWWMVLCLDLEMVFKTCLFKWQPFLVMVGGIIWWLVFPIGILIQLLSTKELETVKLMEKTRIIAKMKLGSQQNFDCSCMINLSSQGIFQSSSLILFLSQEKQIGMMNNNKSCGKMQQIREGFNRYGHKKDSNTGTVFSWWLA